MHSHEHPALPQAALSTGRQEHLASAWRTVGDALKSSSHRPKKEEAQEAAWAAGQMRYLLDHLARHVGTIETSLPKLKEPPLREALGVLLGDAAERCTFLARDLDIARGETLGEPERGWSKRVDMAGTASAVATF